MTDLALAFEAMSEVSAKAFEIRQAGPADAPAVAEVHLCSHRETYVALVGEKDYWPAELAERLSQWQGLLAGEGVVFVASERGRIVGFAHALGA